MSPAVTTPELPRFSRVVRWVHWSAGGLTISCILTAALLYNGALAVLVGDRRLVEQVHVWSGYALLVPLAVGLLARSARTEARRLERLDADDWRWLRSRSRHDGTIPVGKYNAGQKLNAALSVGGLAALLVTGTVMQQTGLTSIAARTGATFVHDWAALCLGLLVLGHLTYAVRDRTAMRGMRHGTVDREWAQREHSAWAAELAAQQDRAADSAAAGERTGSASTSSRQASP